MSLPNNLFQRLSAFVDKTKRVKNIARLKAAELDNIHRFLPQMTPDKYVELNDSSADYRSEHHQYTKTVSSAQAAISLEQTGMLVWIMRNMKPNKVMDTGSGFSSYILRKEIGGQPDNHYAIEDHTEWLGKTCEYLKSKNLSCDNVLHWNQVKQTADFAGKFNFIYHDMGVITTRILSLPTIISWLAPGGLLILDDMHKPHYHPHAIEILKAHGLDYTSLVGISLDEYGRFAYAAKRL